jgi:hypothetical protein
MANQLYGYNTSSYGAAPAAAAATSSLSSVYDSRSLSDRTILRYIGSDPSTTKYSLSDLHRRFLPPPPLPAPCTKVSATPQRQMPRRIWSLRLHGPPRM